MSPSYCFSKFIFLELLLQLARIDEEIEKDRVFALAQILKLFYILDIRQLADVFARTAWRQS
jgi:hypothetical protein